MTALTDNQSMYNTPGTTESDIGTQIVTDFYQKKALIELKKETFFGQLADVTAMPKNMGKTIKRYHYMPLLDDANINDQGIDADGVSTVVSISLVVTRADGSIPRIPEHYGRGSDNKFYFQGEGANAEAAEDDLVTNFMGWCNADTAGGGLELGLGSDDAAFATAVTTGAGSAYALGFRFADTAGTTVTVATGMSAITQPESGNLYGSSKDVGTITDKLPALSEAGGRVNRVGFKRIELEGTISKFGFFDEYTQESLDFDSDADLAMHINREMLFGANEITEDAIQIDLLNGAGVVRYAGVATSDATITGVGAVGTNSEIQYDDLMKLSVDLDNNRCPKHTTIITGSRMVDTKVVRAARIMYIGSELIESFERMTDYHGNPAFVPLAQYADAASSEINGEIGAVGPFRIVVVPEMMHWAGSSGDAIGAAEGTNAGYRTTGGYYNVYPALVVGDSAFTTIGFQTSGKSTKFTIYHKKPGEAVASFYDPYGETGFMSIKWYYGSMILRPERIALIKCVARW